MIRSPSLSNQNNKNKNKQNDIKYSINYFILKSNNPESKQSLAPDKDSLLNKS